MVGRSIFGESRSVHDRSLHVPYAERLEGFDHARGDSALPYTVKPIRPREARAEAGVVPQAQPERADPDDRRPRRRATSRSSSRARSSSTSRRRPGSSCRRAIARVAPSVIQWLMFQMGGDRTDAGPGERVLSATRPRRSVRDRSLSEGNQASLHVLDRRLGEITSISPATIRSPTSRPGRGSPCTVGRAWTSTICRTCSVGSTRSARARRW